MTDLFDDLSFRGLIHQETDREGLRQHAAVPRRVYCGFDPTASSLTIGNLVPILMLRRFQDAGHTPYVVMGGGTGLIGDPSGKEAERALRSREEIENNVAGQRPIFERILRFTGPNAAVIKNNAEWLSRISFLEALRDIGKHFSVNVMIQRDSVRRRLEEREQGISYTEFSYLLLQAYDFQYLFDAHEVTVQVAGSDQWGNIVAGIDLTRKTRQKELFGLTAPLVTKADGSKFGKSETGAVWLTADRTSPYAFYQFWLGTLDADVGRYLKIFTLLPRDEIESLIAQHDEDPGARIAHRALAAHVTELVHGVDAREQAEAASRVLFSDDFRSIPEDTLLEVLEHESALVTSHERSLLEGEGAPLVDFLVAAQVAKSKRESREFLTTGAISVNGEKMGPESRLTAAHLLHGKLALVRRGKKKWHVCRFTAG